MSVFISFSLRLFFFTCSFSSVSVVSLGRTWYIWNGSKLSLLSSLFCVTPITDWQIWNIFYRRNEWYCRVIFLFPCGNSKKNSVMYIIPTWDVKMNSLMRDIAIVIKKSFRFLCCSIKKKLLYMIFLQIWYLFRICRIIRNTFYY